MKANELRIGNLIFDENNEIKEVEGISRKGSIHEEIRVVYFIDTLHGCFSEACNPIPLTEEWLLKFGFNSMTHKGIGVHNDMFSGVITLEFNSFAGDFDFRISHKNIAFIQFVHQLQNLCFALTGEELKQKI